MTNPTDAKQKYEGAILNQLIKNSERLAVVENDIAQVKKNQETAKWLLITTALGVLVNIISPPLVSFFNH